MIKTVTVINYLGEELTIDMRHPEYSGIYIKNITGIGPSKANVVLTEKTTLDGASYTSARTTSRNIVLNLGFMFTKNNTIEELRHKSYKYFPVKKKVTLRFNTDKRVCETYGFVESNEPNIFNKEETTQISILCPDSYFYSPDHESAGTNSFLSIEPMFEFPFSNESTTSKLIEFSNIRTGTKTNVRYDGDAEVGVLITAHATGNVSNISFSRIIDDSEGSYGLGYETIRLDTKKMSSSTNDILKGKEIITGDDIIISTVRGDKYIKLLRDGKYINLLNYIDRDVNWFQLHMGDNTISYEAESGATNLKITIQHKIAYEGV